MPRPRTRYTTSSLVRVRMKDLRSSGLWVPGDTNTGSITAEGRRPIIVTLDYSGTDPVLLHQTQTVYTVSELSNLGVGRVHYFICPSTSTRCRVLYYLPSTGIFVSRVAITPNLVYPVQSRGCIDMYHILKDELKVEESLRNTTTYVGKETRRAKRIRQLRSRVERYEARIYYQMLSLIGRCKV